MKEPSEKARKTWVRALTSITSLMAMLDAIVVAAALSATLVDLGTSIEALE
jgi:hypothetical protein